MIAIVMDSEETFRIEGISEAELMTLYMIAETCHFQKQATNALAEEAQKFGELIEEYYKNSRKEQIKFLN